VLILVAKEVTNKCLFCFGFQQLLARSW